VRWANHQGWAAVRIEAPNTTEATWEVRFEPADSYRYPTQAPGGLQVERVGLDGVDFKWGAQYYLNAGYQVYLDGILQGYTPDTSFPFRGLDPRRSYAAEVRAVWMDGTIGERHKPAELKFSVASLLPDELPLAGLEPLRRMVRPAPGRPVNLGGKRFGGGISAGANAEVEYDLLGLYDAFSALVGIDDGSTAAGPVEFIILGDGKELWRSGPVKKGDGLKPAQVSLAGAQKIVLKTVAAAPPPAGGSEFRGRGGPQAVWIEAKVSGRSAGRS
jgi:hypothetical protein